MQGPKRGASDPSGYVMEDLLAHAVDNMRIKNVDRTQLARRAEQPAPSLLVRSCSHPDPALSCTNATRLGLILAATDLRQDLVLLESIGWQQRGPESASQTCVPINSCCERPASVQSQGRSLDKMKSITHIVVMGPLEVQGACRSRRWVSA